MRKKILCAGLAVADIIVRPVNERVFREAISVETPRLGPGGDALNQAIVLTRLGADCALSTCVGRDPWGDFLLDVMQKEGVGMEPVRRVEGHGTSTCVILIEPEGERHFLACLDATDAYTPDPEETLAPYDVISIGSLWGLPGLRPEHIHRLSRYTRERGKLLATDFTDNTRGDGVPYALEVLGDFDYLIPSYDEGVQLADGETDPEAILWKLRDKGAKNIVLKLGAEGCAALIDGSLYRQKTLASKVVDTTGAGDNFAATFLYCLTRELDPQTSLRLASRASARCIAEIGATGARYTFEELLAEDRA